MESNPATRAIARIAIAFVIGDLLLAFMIMFKQPGEATIVAILMGTLIGQFGLGCAAILRHETLWDGAVCWLFLLVSGSAILPVFFNQAHNSGYIVLFALIIAGVSLATNLLPCITLRLMTSGGRFQFSILHIMLLMTLVGVSILITSATYLFVLSAIGFALFLLIPSAIGCLLIGLFSKKRTLLVTMTLIAILIGAGWAISPQGEPIWHYLLAQTLTVMLGGYFITLIELRSVSDSVVSSAATGSPLRSELAPDPLDGP
ncbi:hypothetical protein C5Y96_12020 [Blastopirellula marina]|uniref:Uncharacterized protein n=1 Tax=Blastopirellula marina TaxID=124 RepID=A0A2S8FFX8_9BACT|nr:MULTISPECIES: hypothetical protein [Pirellulaceae]PQO31078.1 hypothetical protein C5Y96_12020 [Blastopirellula marina]RCS51472.1 hypothetical protein DTL36_12030 [Bremerella cremea]